MLMRVHGFLEEQASSLACMVFFLYGGLDDEFS